MSNNVAELLPEGLSDPVDMVEGFKVNTSNEQIIKNIEHSIRLQLPQFDQQNLQYGAEICIVGGGWSLDETKDELLDICWNRGASIIALNGAAKWLMERNIRPAIHMILDARPENAEFVIDIPGCKYLIASQCAPETFEACKDKETYIYHVVQSDKAVNAEDYTPEPERILDEYYNKHWISVIGGSTVGLRAIALARMLGFESIHLFGIDSCYSPTGEHHAYPQELNDGEGSGRMYLALNNETELEGREFRCSTWQASQAQQFRDFLATNGKYFRLHIHGDGVLAYMLKTGASLGGQHGGDGMGIL